MNGVWDLKFISRLFFPNSNCLNTIIPILNRETSILCRREGDYCFNADCIICLTGNITRDLRMQKDGNDGDVRLQEETITQELDSKSGMFVVSAKNLPFSLASFPF